MRLLNKQFNVPYLKKFSILEGIIFNSFFYYSLLDVNYHANAIFIKNWTEWRDYPTGRNTKPIRINEKLIYINEGLSKSVNYPKN
jgi:hypothetical protein